MIIRLTLTLAALSATPAARAAPFADPVLIDRDVAGFTGIPQGEPGGAALPVDRRLKLTACRSPLAFGWHTPRRETVTVQCPDAGGWRLFVPILATQGAAATAPAVLRGEAVTISVGGDGFTVSQSGEAMEAGAVGAWIRVRLAQGGVARGEPMRAQVVRPGLVSVPMP